MKTKYLLILAIPAFLSSTATFAQTSTINTDLKMYEQVWNDIVNKGRIDLINDTNFDPNILQINSNGNIEGIADFKAYYQNFVTGFSNINFTVEEAFGQGNTIMKHWRFKGKHTGDFFGIPATGRMVDVEGVTLANMKNGKIAQEQDFMDNSILMQQLGIASDPNNITVIDHLYKSFSKGDIPAVLAMMDAHIVWNEAEGNQYANGNPYIGPEAIVKGVFARIGEEHEYFKLKDIQLHEMSNNQVLATLRYEAKVKASKETYDAQVAHFWTLKNGKITSFQQFMDTKQVAEAMKI